jgi:hypothetical protein
VGANVHDDVVSAGSVAWNQIRKPVGFNVSENDLVGGTFAIGELKLGKTVYNQV